MVPLSKGFRRALLTLYKRKWQLRLMRGGQPALFFQCSSFPVPPNLPHSRGLYPEVGLKTRPDFIRICFIIKAFFSGEMLFLSTCSSPAFPWDLGKSQSGHLTDGRSLHLLVPSCSMRTKDFFFFFWKLFLERPQPLPYMCRETQRPESKSSSISSSIFNSHIT